ncbi:TPA: zf-TFIIB domain-containing protein [Stenotrophomonas maltophilia]|uniref:TFIIB-type zinc ribbon-containing protein n=1 Tax=Stenotrophomonas TaxID=40323 RepID=UPI0013107B1F|nr:zf-TFIIB domain-containing protein [Stenotrophomonas maltophilia]MBN5088359.1 zf-TFIIB domain-containing protein [Stenotrophomonas maltophilia]MDG2508604.1 zf-TFIIB domain-containing protein [Stenotrophomonas maltophilia]HEL3197004.1 zf-TFIIB domain-containing protein [Stenotrophomonas maltophilia]HEL3257810.1 zf-TFIIB domain-containing protein [Stenotrophomonas maltophilia]
MLCPVCKTQTLQMAERHGIEIDYCPGCRGVWLDRGELDKIIERAGAGAGAGAGAAVPPPAPVQQHPASSPPPVMHRDTRHLGQRYEDNRGHGYKKKKKDSFLSELFDF